MADTIELERTDDLKDGKVLYGMHSIEVKNGKARVPVEVVDELIAPGGGFKAASKKAESALESRTTEPNETQIGEATDLSQVAGEDSEPANKSAKK